MMYTPDPRTPGRESLITVAMIRQVVQQHEETEARVSASQEEGREPEPCPADAEPHLSAYLCDELLKLYGHMSLNGVESAMVRTVALEIRRLFHQTIYLLRSGYGELLDGLMPGSDGKVRVHPAKPDAPGASPADN